MPAIALWSGCNASHSNHSTNNDKVSQQQPVVEQPTVLQNDIAPVAAEPCHDNPSDSQSGHHINTCTSDPDVTSKRTNSNTNMQQTRMKRVRISDDAPKIAQNSHANTDCLILTETERSDSWWSAFEFAQVKDAVKKQCRKHRQRRRYSACLTQAYDLACWLAASQESTVLLSCTKPPQIEPATESSSESTESSSSSSSSSCTVSELLPTNSQQQPEDSGAPSIAHPLPFSLPAEMAPGEGFLQWMHDEGPRGLEGYASRLHAIRRQRHVQEAKHAVFLEQARQNITHERDEERLAQQAEVASRRARTFASLLGHADAWAARRLHSECPPGEATAETCNSPRPQDHAALPPSPPQQRNPQGKHILDLPLMQHGFHPFLDPSLLLQHCCEQQQQQEPRHEHLPLQEMSAKKPQSLQCSLVLGTSLSCDATAALAAALQEDDDDSWTGQLGSILSPSSSSLHDWYEDEL